jgi:hypothetical protein
MKNILFCLLLFFSLTSQGQKQPLPANCPDLKQKLLLIKQSFSNLQKFKKELLPGSTYKYATSLTICGVMGEMQVYDSGAEIIFKFKEDKFTDDDGKLTAAFVANFRKLAKAVFGSTYEETYDKDADEMWGEYEYYEYKPYTASYPHIRIDYPFADDLIWITFEYDK